MGRWTWKIVLTVALITIVPPVAAQIGDAEMEAELIPERITVSTTENQTVSVLIKARLQCLPEHEAPRNLHGYFTSFGHGDDPVYWRIEPSELRVPWRDVGDGLYVIGETVRFQVYADTPAPHRAAGEQETTLYINGGRSGTLGPCTPTGHEWDAQSLPLTVVVPATTEENDSFALLLRDGDGRIVSPLRGLVLFLSVVLVAFLVHRWEERKRRL